MIIHINAAAAFKHLRTGVEEYTYQLIKHLMMPEESRKHRFILYTAWMNPASEQARYGAGADKESRSTQIDSLPENFEIKKLDWPLKGWTQIRLSCEMLKNRNKKDILFTPAHVLPIIHPKNSVVTIHGLEYEYYPEMYPPFHRKYLRWSTKYALKYARKIIADSENTKQDLIKLYSGDPKKIEVIYHGVGMGSISNFSACAKALADRQFPTLRVVTRRVTISNDRYILYLGRIEIKKNIIGIIRAFEILKKHYKIPHKLILAGPAGFGFHEIKKHFDNSDYQSEIEMLGYVSKKEKWALLKNADVFIFPSFYEGFGFPVLEAQSAGAPVVASASSSFPEILGDSALLVDPQKSGKISEAVYSLISNKTLRQSFIQKGYENVKRFSWEKCARETLRVMLEMF